MVENGLRPIYFRNWGQKCFRVLRVLSQLERRLSCHVPGFKSAHPAVPVTNTQLCIMRIMLNHVLCKGARVSVQSHIPPVKFPQTPVTFTGGQIG